ncbi:MAG TPA: RraA family protein, partial [Gammaproteobacteria bacterium]|nr:RraA family protein [Gammaproteobacteria bacterium]
MPDASAFAALSPTTLADALDKSQVMDFGIRPLWQSMPRIAGPAYPVRCASGDNL